MPDQIERMAHMIAAEVWNYREPNASLPCPLFAVPVAAGFPSPAEDYLERSLDLNELVVRRPEATFFVRVKGESMIEAHIHSGDILVVDRSIEPRDGHIVVAVLDGEFTVKQLQRRDNGVLLQPANRQCRPLMVAPHRDFLVWGVVTYVIHAV